MDKNHLNDLLFNPSECPEDNILLQYVKDELSPQLRRMVELHLPDCEICTDTLEGLQRVNPQVLDETISTISTQIDEHVTRKKDNRKSIFAQWYLVAAALLIIVLSGFIYRYYFETLKESNVADVIKTNKADELTEIDSIVTKSETELSNVESKNDKKTDPITIKNTLPISINKSEYAGNAEGLAEAPTAIAEQNSEKSLDLAAPKIVETPLTEAEDLKKVIDDDAIKAIGSSDISANFSSATNSYSSPASTPIINNAPQYTLSSAKSKEKAITKEISASDMELKDNFDNKNIAANARAKKTDSNHEKECKMNYDKACKFSLENNNSLAETEFKNLIKTNCVQWNEMAKIDLALLYIKLSKKNQAIVLLNEAKNSVIKVVANRANIELEKVNK